VTSWPAHIWVRRKPFTRQLLERALGATVLFDEFGDLIHQGFAGRDANGQAIIGALVPWMENHRKDETVVIGAG
jgi:hypothetical protein